MQSFFVMTFSESRGSTSPNNSSGRVRAKIAPGFAGGRPAVEPYIAGLRQVRLVLPSRDRKIARRHGGLTQPQYTDFGASTKSNSIWPSVFSAVLICAIVEVWLWPFNQIIGGTLSLTCAKRCASSRQCMSSSGFSYSARHAGHMENTPIDVLGRS